MASKGSATPHSALVILRSFKYCDSQCSTTHARAHLDSSRNFLAPRRLTCTCSRQASPVMRAHRTLACADRADICEHMLATRPRG